MRATVIEPISTPLKLRTTQGGSLDRLRTLPVPRAAICVASTRLRRHQQLRAVRVGARIAEVKTLTGPQAASYDSLMQRLERRYFPDTRAWVCERAEGDTLEVAVGTGLNLPYYSELVRLTAVDASLEMLALARTRARTLSRTVVFAEGDASALPYADASFDSVVCTFALCEVPDDAQVVGELLRVLRPGGNLLLADHVIATGRFVRLAQRLLEAITIPLGGEHYTRRPSHHLSAPTVELVDSDRFAHGAVEQVHARKAMGDPPADDGTHAVLG